MTFRDARPALYFRAQRKGHDGACIGVLLVCLPFVWRCAILVVLLGQQGITQIAAHLSPLPQGTGDPEREYC